MKVRVRFVYVIGAVLLSLAGFYWLGYSKASVRADNLSTALLRAQDTITVYKVKIQQLENTVFETSTIILRQKEAIAIGMLGKERLRKLHIKSLITNTRLKGEILVLKDSLKHSNVIRYDTVMFDNDTKPCIELPAQFLYEGYYVGLDVLVYERDWEFILNVDVPLEITVTDNRSIVTTANPYVFFNKIETVVIPGEVGFWDKPVVKWVTRGAFFGAGVWVGTR